MNTDINVEGTRLGYVATKVLVGILEYVRVELYGAPTKGIESSTGGVASLSVIGAKSKAYMLAPTCRKCAFPGETVFRRYTQHSALKTTSTDPPLNCDQPKRLGSVEHTGYSGDIHSSAVYSWTHHTHTHTHTQHVQTGKFGHGFRNGTLCGGL